MAGGGAKLNDVKIEDAALVVSKDTFGEASEIKVASPLRPHPYVPPLYPPQVYAMHSATVRCKSW